MNSFNRLTDVEACHINVFVACIDDTDIALALLLTVPRVANEAIALARCSRLFVLNEGGCPRVVLLSPTCRCC